MKRFSAIIILILLLSGCSSALSSTPAAGFTPQGTNALSSQAANTPTPTLTPSPEGRIVNAEQELLNGDYDQALIQYQTVITATDDPLIVASGQLGIGKLYLRKGQYDQALQQFTWIIDNFPSSKPQNLAVFYLARTYDAQQQYNQAAQTYQRYLELAPGPLDSEILTLEGNALQNAGNAASALPVYEKALTTAVAANQESLQIKIAQAYEQTGNAAEALKRYQDIYTASTSDYTKAQMDLAMGSLYISQGQNEDAYAKLQDAVANYPTSNDTYQALVILVNDNQPVSDLNRGIIDYYAGQYGVAAEALNRYIIATPEHDGTPHYYRALSLYNLGDTRGEIDEWDSLIRDHPNDRYLAKAYLEKSTTQWNVLNQYEAGAATLLEFVTLHSAAPEAPQYLFQAGRIYERNNRPDKAAATWERIINEYPSSSEAYTGLFEAGICYFRLGELQKAQVTFQRTLVLATTPSDTAAAALWVGKTYAALSDPSNARTYFTQAAAADPTGYYSIRAQQLLDGQAPFPAAVRPDLAVSLDTEMVSAANWLTVRLNLPAGTDLTNFDEISSDPLFKRGDLFLNLGFVDQARGEFDSLQNEYQTDAAKSFELLHYLENAGLYRNAVLTSRQVLDIIGMSQLETLKAPVYFNHVRFAVFYRDAIVSAANSEGIDPLLIFSLVRQESLYEGSIVSSAGAVGLMQILPAVGAEIASDYGWPPNYIASDLYNPSVNVRLGTHYLKKWLDYFNGNAIAAFAAYNGGIGNTLEWQQIAGNDPDLLLEVIRFDETRDYIRYIAENYEIYKSIYTHP
jgi:soluble lytic murein transglycosylase